MSRVSRRRILRGMLNGGAVTVALPFLNCFLNSNGTALASGEPLPVRFGTWFWGLGMSHSIFVPKKTGANYELPEEIAMLQPWQKHINLFTNFNVMLDANPNLCHYTGWVALRSGIVPPIRGAMPGESIDVSIAQVMGGQTRFRSLDANATGDVRDSISYAGQDAYNAPEISPVNFYQRVFGPDFQDPNASTFTPNPRVLVQKSALSAVMEEAKALNRTVGAEDRARLDQYFTGLRELERQLENQLQKPDPIPACKASAAPKGEIPAGQDVELVGQRHKLMTDIMVMAVACNQTRVFNLLYTNAQPNTVKKGYDKGHHVSTHEELVDETLGYQIQSSWFTRRAMESWAYFVKTFAEFPEGDGSLLDNTLVYAHSDQSFAKIHDLKGIPMFTAGKAGGRMKTGLHIDGGGTPSARLGYTVLRTLNIDIPSWGGQSNKTSKDIGEILA